MFDYTLFAPNGVAYKATKYGRNVVYQFHEVKDLDMLLVDQVERSTDSRQVTATELNQLKYTCRKLNKETKRLTTSLNEVIFSMSSQTAYPTWSSAL
jgi:hypothetical protein